MKLLGLDFDNTIVDYDELFYKISLERNLIERSHPVNKMKIRDHLNNSGMKEEFTLIQGEVYGQRIEEAKASKNLISTLKKIKSDSLKIVIISHKTTYPYVGARYNLRQAAMGWLNKNSFFNDEGIGIKEKDVYFKSTKKEKINMIRELGCDIYVDDLEEIIIEVDKFCCGINYDPKGQSRETAIRKIADWKDIEQYL